MGVVRTLSIAPTVQASRLTEEFGAHAALDGLSLGVRPGEIVCLLGANGAGRTTTINLLPGFFEPDEGSALVADYAPGSPEARRATGHVPEAIAAYPKLSGIENLGSTMVRPIRIAVLSSRGVVREVEGDRAVLPNNPDGMIAAVEELLRMERTK
jgi:ABC-type sugar transport system ATPase subunit